MCRAIKSDPQTRGVAVVMLTARDHEIDRVVGFELGADDYVTKPFSVRELLLRIRAVLRRTGGTAPNTNGVVEFGRLKIDRGAHRTWVAGKEIELTTLELRLLLTLYDRRNRVQPRAVVPETRAGILPVRRAHVVPRALLRERARTQRLARGCAEAIGVAPVHAGDWQVTGQGGSVRARIVDLARTQTRAPLLLFRRVAALVPIAIAGLGGGRSAEALAFSARRRRRCPERLRYQGSRAARRRIGARTRS